VWAQEHQTPGGIEIVQVRPNVFMLVGAGGNIVVHLGWMGAVVVDTGAENMAAEVVRAIGRITDKKVRYIINTSADFDRVGGNEAVAKAGLTLPRWAGFGGSPSEQNSGPAAIMAHENVLRKMSAELPGRGTTAFPRDGWPIETSTGARVTSIYLNGEGIQTFYQPAAHTDADILVFFRRADVVVAGSILDLRHFPIIDVDNGGSINGEIAALNRIVEMAVPAAPFAWHDDRTIVVPGHGRLMDQADVVEYRDMVTIIRDVIQDMIDKGMTLDQVKKADPTKGYRKQYGSEVGPWTTDMFVTAVYRSLAGTTTRTTR
jgi:glyoxylase-like metal-dependent hydrolase (beta-lactamase superfamily II)